MSFQTKSWIETALLRHWEQSHEGAQRKPIMAYRSWLLKETSSPIWNKNLMWEGELINNSSETLWYKSIANILSIYLIVRNGKQMFSCVCLKRYY